MGHSYFPLAGGYTDPNEAELAAVVRQQQALWLRMEDGLARAKALVDPPLPPVLQGQVLHGASMRHGLGVILVLVLPAVVAAAAGLAG